MRCIFIGLVDTVYGLFQVAVGCRYGLEQAFVKEVQAVTDFVLDAWLVDAYFISFPQHLYLLLDFLPDRVALMAAQAPVSKLLAGYENPA